MPSKWLRDHQKREHEDHKKRIKNMRSSIDTTAPREMPMSKRNEIERERKRSLIEQDNRLLLDRLAIAMSSKNIDNVMIPKPFISLMELQRKKELKKIMVSNNRLLDRIQNTIPSYDHVLWEKDSKHHMAILRNMTEFPEHFVEPGKHIKGSDVAVQDEERRKLKEIMGHGGKKGRRSPDKWSPGEAGKSGPFEGEGGEEAGVGGVLAGRFPEDEYLQYQQHVRHMQQQMEALAEQQMQQQMLLQQQQREKGEEAEDADFQHLQQQQQLLEYQMQQSLVFQQQQALFMQQQGAGVVGSGWAASQEAGGPTATTGYGGQQVVPLPGIRGSRS